MSGGSAARVLDLLVARDESVAAAESLTGGLLAAALTDVPGASRVFRGAVTAYATDVKRDVLGVDGALLAERGAVDRDVALSMADGVRRLLAADWGVSTTGVAGPGPQDGQQAGTVHVAVAGPRGAAAHALLELPGDRQAVRVGTVQEALGLLLHELLKNASGHDTERSGGS
ncbi:CinA family protein [Streptomyces meridianus]|uniref:Nicotinamide-nucleotide amidohydrolase family protein n=1 Tax=Streptomyces meridianus TaxID=2938945 RepID=A0ABT0X8E3_9ACTN|nr:nicotinamide-nucleotide amidohydrolase family protein [Streptomyces meridianus]MCM2578781.1 nicotinamide-nucleotide amidohydrolase family protein [Streptomyces meridianus]